MFYLKPLDFMKSRSNCNTPDRKLIWNDTVAERVQHAACIFQKIEKAPAKSRKHPHQFWQQVLQMLTTQPNKEFDLFLCLVMLWVFGVCFLEFICVVSICNMYVAKIDEVVFLICRVFFSICSALSSLGHHRNDLGGGGHPLHFLFFFFTQWWL